MNKCGGRYFGKYCRITAIRTSVINGITTFLVICYAECVSVFFNLFDPVHFYSKDGSIFQPSPQLWLNGELVYFSKQHLPYALPAVFSLITIGLFPPILLLIYPLAIQQTNEVSWP